MGIVIFSTQTKLSSSLIPVAREKVEAGFPSPAEHDLDSGIDLNEYLIHHPASTFFIRVSGYSMTGAGIYDGDLLVIDRSLEARPGCIVIAILDGNFTLKRLAIHNGKLRLEAEHPDYQPIDFNDYNNIQIWGVAVHSIHHLQAKNQY